MKATTKAEKTANSFGWNIKDRLNKDQKADFTFTLVKLDSGKYSAFFSGRDYTLMGEKGTINHICTWLEGVHSMIIASYRINSYEK